MTEKKLSYHLPFLQLILFKKKIYLTKNEARHFYTKHAKTK